MRFLKFVAAAGLWTASLTCALHATTYDVGPGQPYLTVASVPDPLPGDVINIHCGTYNEVRNWTSSGAEGAPITLQGVCSTGQPVIDARRKNVSGDGGTPRAAWQIQGAYYVIRNLAFQNASNKYRNGSGIRVMNTGVTISHVTITHCDMGFMTSTASATNLLVENTEIAYNGTNKLDGQTHNVYLTSGSAITFQFCFIHDALSGTNFKSRSHDSQLLYSYIAFGAQNEVDGDDAADTSTPNSNMVLIGNIIVSKANRTLNTSQFINFGQDLGGTHSGTLYLINNTLIAGSGSIGFLRSTASNSAVVAVNNIFYGSNAIVQPGYGSGVSGYNNWLPSTSALPPGFSNDTLGSDPGFVNASANDYRLTSTSTARNIGFSLPLYYDGNGVVQSGVPVWEYVQLLSSATRPSDGSLDVGAYEYQ